MRVSALNTREEWARVEKALQEDIGVLRKELAKVKKELRGKMLVPFVQRLIQWFVPFVQRLIQGRGKLVDEIITLEEPPQSTEVEPIEEQCVLLLPGRFLRCSRELLCRSDSWRAPPMFMSYLMDQLSIALNNLIYSLYQILVHSHSR
jgi:hypothetical protein